MKISLSIFGALLLAFTLLFISGCKKDPVLPPSPPSPPPPMETTVGDYLKSLPTWAEFSPPLADMEAAPTGAPPVDEGTITMDVEEIQDDGSVVIIPDVSYTCQSVPYSITQNPEQIVMYSPDIEILYPGGLIQGKTHRDGLGSLLGINIAERTSVKVSIPGLQNNDNFREVANPSQATVAQAIGSMVGSATAAGLSTPSTISFDMESYHSEKEFALNMGVSGNYLGFSGSASGSIERDRSETTITAQFYQKMFEVVVEPPQTPEAFFNEDFTPAKLQEQVDLGKMGPNNLPVYVSNVVYGRMMMFSMTSTASEDDIRATLQAAYNGIGGNVQGNLSAKQKTILAKSKISIASLGGDANATISMIKGGNWKDYFTETADLTSAAPLSYTFRNLGDGSIAKVTEATEYNIKECTAVAANPGVFNFEAEKILSMSDISFPVATHNEDMNGDGKVDLVFLHLNNMINQVKVALNNGMGGFDVMTVSSNPHTPAEGDWQNYKVVFGDLDGDQKEDIIWSNPTATKNTTFAALSNGDGTFDYLPVTEFASGGWQNYVTIALDYDNDGADELLWNEANTVVNRIYTSDFDGTNFILEPFVDLPGQGWGAYTVYVGQVNGGGEDLIWNEVENGNFHSTYSGIFNGTQFTLGPRSVRGGSGWSTYATHLGNVGGNTNTDLVFNELITNHNYIYTDLANNDGSFNVSNSFEEHPADEDWAKYQMDIGDVSGDGLDDLIWSVNGNGEATNSVYVALSTTSGEFDFSPVAQQHPATALWSQYESFCMDVNSDQKADIIWISTGPSTTLHIGLAK